ncbi:MAG: glutamate--tRNA ligase [Bacilli bacterium]
MNNKELANLIFPDITKTIEDYEKIYPARNLNEGAVVSRFAPSPTGFVHMGSLLSALIASKVPKETNGIFYLRIEDTDGKRSVENGIQGIIDDLKNFEINIDEGVVSETKQIGNYGPYIQSERKEIYQTFVKYLIANDLAYPCFCTEEETNEIRTIQEAAKERIGYYGHWAKCRNLSNEERSNRIKNGDKYIIRLKSPGNFNNKVVIEDLVRGRIEFPENDLDIVLIKSDGLPLYHLAHLVDDHLMRTTHILRGEEWVSSLPVHLQLFKIFNFKTPKYAHLGVIMKIDDDQTRRKLSKRKDPEAAVSYYHEKGIPVEAVKIYLMTIANSNFEAWYNANPNKTIDDFTFSFKKMSESGSLFDVDKLMNISKNYISKLKAIEVYERTIKWAKFYDQQLEQLLIKYQDYSIKIFNIEREQKKPRKDFGAFCEIKSGIWYMYDELFINVDYQFQTISDINEINKINQLYLSKYYNELDDKETWFSKMRLVAFELGYAKEMSDYKENPDKYKGHIGDVSMVIRVSLTSLSATPDLYEIMKLLGKERINQRLNIIKVK